VKIFLATPQLTNGFLSFLSLGISIKYLDKRSQTHRATWKLVNFLSLKAQVLLKVAFCFKKLIKHISLTLAFVGLSLCHAQPLLTALVGVQSSIYVLMYTCLCNRISDIIGHKLWTSLNHFWLWRRIRHPRKDPN